MRKAEKRVLGEAKAKREAEERRQAGLAAQKAGREAERKRKGNTVENDPGFKLAISLGIKPGTGVAYDQKKRSILLNRGINPSTGVVFTEDEMYQMDRKANTPERRHLFERIRAGRAGTLDEIDDYLDGITVGQFRNMVEVYQLKAEERMRQGMTNPDRAREFAKAAIISGFFQTAAEGLERMAQEALKDYGRQDMSATEEIYGTRPRDRADASARFDRFIGEMEEIKTGLEKKNDL